jgi:hypothetical protein
MKIIRSILAIVVGGLLVMVIVDGVEMANFVVYATDEKASIAERLQQSRERMEEFAGDKEAMKAFVASLPTEAMVVVFLGWQAAAFLGGGVSALIAGRRRLLHAGIIGVLVLAGTILAVLHIKHFAGLSHPDWMLIAGLLSPIPLSLIAGKIVSLLFPPPSTPQLPMDQA